MTRPCNDECSAVVVIVIRNTESFETEIFLFLIKEYKDLRCQRANNNNDSYLLLRSRHNSAVTYNYLKSDC